MNPILHLTLSLNVGGRERLIVDLCNSLHELGHSSIICCLKESGDLSKELNPATQIYEIQKKKGIDFGIIKRLRKLIKKKSVKIVQCHNPGTLFYGMLATLFLKKVYVVNTEHGFVAKRNKKNVIKDRILYSLVNEITVVSEPLKADLKKWYNVPEEKITIVKNGIKPIEIFEDSRVTKIRLNLNPHYRYIGIVARLTPIKNHKLLIDAFYIISKKYDDIHLLIVGDGELRYSLVDYVEKLALSEKVYFLGTRSDVRLILNAIDLFVLSSDSEGMSMAILEAMAAGLPVVATDVGGNKELVLHEQTGFLVPPNDPEKLSTAIDKILSNENLSKKFGKNSKRHFNRNYSIFNTTKKMMEIYSKYSN